VAAQSRGVPQQLGIFAQGPQKGQGNAASGGGNYGGPVGTSGGAAVSGIGGMTAGQAGPAIKYQNGGILGGGAPTGAGTTTGNIMNHK